MVEQKIWYDYTENVLLVVGALLFIVAIELWILSTYAPIKHVYPHYYLIGGIAGVYMMFVIFIAKENVESRRRQKLKEARLEIQYNNPGAKYCHTCGRSLYE